MKSFILKTVITGIIILIPIGFSGYILFQALEIARKIAQPAVNWVNVDSYFGILMVYALAVALLVLVCFLLGLVGHISAIAKRTEALDRAFSNRIPGYSMIKGMVGGVIQDEDSVDGFKPVLVKYYNMSRIGYEVERSTEGQVTVFLPNAPNPQSGTTLSFDAKDVTQLDIAPHKVMELLQFYGKGLSEVTK